MANKPNLSQKRNGKYYTPRELADALIKPLINKKSKSIFDPAYGDGALLLAATRALSAQGVHNYDKSIFGCDRQPVNGCLAQFPKSHLVKSDFFDYPTNQKFDVIVMNPPYVKHHLMSDNKREKYQERTADLCKLNYKSDLWGYFLVKAVGHLQDGGSIGAILPWSFLQAEYAVPIRRWLVNSFEHIDVLALSRDFFEDADERIVLVWLKNFANPSRSIKIGFSQHIGSDNTCCDLSLDQWLSPTVLFTKGNDLEDILTEYTNSYEFQKLKEFSDIRIGVVTGADDFFILKETAALQEGFSTKDLVPILRSAREFNGLYLNGIEIAYRLIKMSRKSRQKYKKYIAKGLEIKVNERAHAMRREPWHLVNPGRIADAFFPYRSTAFPYMVLNNKKVQCTNSIHRIYFRDLKPVEQQWIQVSLLSIPGQLSLEAYSKVYGSGVLKTEPRALKEALVHRSSSKDIEMIYHQCSELIQVHKRREAVRIATDFLCRKLNIPAELSKRAESTLTELQERRLVRGT